VGKAENIPWSLIRANFADLEGYGVEICFELSLAFCSRIARLFESAVIIVEKFCVYLVVGRLYSILEVSL